eukprot:CAMPEP_0170133968 /NCGR_PEP_ID=MMETSP0033_2-20121228/1634_1 /TAXON_ID=195969 /ORGANISM="Dolichomastix tenuilepis, Strain CCMP3274" /LENGTH=54 /DNA_ID=CAMNT_0010369503 /DNA_START=93 /DNA_END=261 /DNA_ORIENTATION=-
MAPPGIDQVKEVAAAAADGAAASVAGPARRARRSSLLLAQLILPTRPLARARFE